MRSLAHYALAYLFWIITCALALLVAWVVRSTYVLLMGVALANPSLNSSQVFNATLRSNAVDRFALVLLGVVVLVVFVLSEYYYRSGASQGRLLRRFWRATALELGLLAVCHLVTLVVLFRAGAASAASILLPVGEFLLAGGLFWLRKQDLDLPPLAPDGA
jgi:hypothetical protein